MFALTRQVQIASDAAKGAGARLAGIAVPSFPDEEKTFDELQARIAKTIDFLAGLKKEQFDGCGDPRHLAQGRRARAEFQRAQPISRPGPSPTSTSTSPPPMPSSATMESSWASRISWRAVSKAPSCSQNHIEKDGTS